MKKPSTASVTVNFKNRFDGQVVVNAADYDNWQTVIFKPKAMHPALKGIVVFSHLIVSLSTNPSFQRTYKVFRTQLPNSLHVHSEYANELAVTTLQKFQFSLPVGTYYFLKSKHLDIQITVQNYEGGRSPCIIALALRYVDTGFIYNVVAGYRVGTIGSRTNPEGYSYACDGNGNGLFGCTFKFKDGSQFTTAQDYERVKTKCLLLWGSGPFFQSIANGGGILNINRYVGPGKLYLRDGSSIEQNAANVPIFAKSWLVPENEMMLNERFFPSTLPKLAENSCQLFKEVPRLEPLPPYSPGIDPDIDDIVPYTRNANDDEIIESNPKTLNYTDEVFLFEIGS